MRPGIIVLTRMSSSRLPGKALRDVAGRPLLQRVLDRLRLVPGGPEVVLATSDDAQDSAIADFAQRESLSIFHGDLADVATRCLEAGEAFGLDPIIRISGDSPFICPKVVWQALSLSGKGKADIVTNLYPRTFPPGVSVEVITKVALRRMLHEPLSSSDREHVTPYIYRHPEKFKIVNFTSNSVVRSNVHLAVDTEADLQRAIWLYDNGIDANTPLAAIINAARHYPDPIQPVLTPDLPIGLR